MSLRHDSLIRILEVSIDLKNIRRRVVGSVLVKIFSERCFRGRDITNKSRCFGKIIILSAHHLEIPLKLASKMATFADML